VPERNEGGEMTEKEVKTLADDHWKWLGGLLACLKDQNFTSITVEYLYKTAFIHGWKHCKQHMEKKQ
jgi:hypothetical protein